MEHHRQHGAVQIEDGVWEHKHPHTHDNTDDTEPRHRQRPDHDTAHHPGHVHYRTRFGGRGDHHPV